MKIRSMPTDMYMKTYAALGVNAVPMSFAETIPGLQQKTIDGVDLPISVLAANRFYDVADYISMTGHFFSPLILCISDSVWDTLTPDEQAILKKAAVDAGVEERTTIEANEADKLQELADNGMEVVDDVNHDAFQKALAEFYNTEKANIGPGLVDELMSTLESLKK
jgi:TRAP-type C4-dicarboxylate transport system substrate-binding protein